MLKLQFITIIWCATVCYAFRQQFGFHTEPNCTGNALILESKQTELTGLAPSIISTSNSISTIGIWRVHSTINYGDFTWAGVFNGGTATMKCWNGLTYRTTKSIRYLGPIHTTTPSISLYEIQHQSGKEITITGPASANIPFTPRSLVTTGNISWTLYSGSDFDGTATCFTPRTTSFFDHLYTLNSTLSNVKSILRGCNRHIDYYIYGSSEA